MQNLDKACSHYLINQLGLAGAIQLLLQHEPTLTQRLNSKLLLQRLHHESTQAVLQHNAPLLQQAEASQWIDVCHTLLDNKGDA